MMVSLCSLASRSRFGQDDLDALLAGLGDEPAVSEAAQPPRRRKRPFEALPTEEALPVAAEAAPAEDPSPICWPAEPP
jgi:hypothetical protein